MDKNNIKLILNPKVETIIDTTQWVLKEGQTEIGINYCGIGYRIVFDENKISLITHRLDSKDDLEEPIEELELIDGRVFPRG